MYLIEGEKGGFTSIPRSVYWCIVTMTTVGYGDIAPITPLGQAFASVIMILGYGIIAVPTGIIGVEIAQAKKVETNTQSCKHCLESYHFDDAKHCHQCGKILNDE
jgi:voltage-gated potassium channel